MKDKIRKGISIFAMLAGVICLGLSAKLLVDNQQAEQTAQVYSQHVVSAFSESLLDAIQQEDTILTTLPATSSDGQTEEVVATIDIDGQAYVGLLTIPKLSLQLPVAYDWSYALLNQTPCLFSGSFVQNNAILIAHNYTAHFGTLPNLSVGDELTFLTATGTLYTYAMTSQTTIDGNDLASLEAGDWDLTLVTCLYGNNTRRVITRFDQVVSAS